MATHIGNTIHRPGIALWRAVRIPCRTSPSHPEPPVSSYKLGAEYDAALKWRGCLTAWFTDEPVQAWRAEPRTPPGGQPHYSALAITTALTLRTVFGLALRQTERLIGSVIGLLGLRSVSYVVTLSAAGNS
jgi:Transposase DDE domain